VVTLVLTNHLSGTMEVLHYNCNMVTCSLPHMYTLCPQIRRQKNQADHSCSCYNCKYAMNDYNVIFCNMALNAACI